VISSPNASDAPVAPHSTGGSTLGATDTTRLSPIVQLTLIRFREFYREPEAVFWTFLFPILMATGLGIAFRTRPAEMAKVGVLETSPRAESVRATLAKEPSLTVELLSDSAAAKALQVGAVALIVVPTDSAAVEYRFDAARSEARAARPIVDGALQRAAGRSDPVRVNDSLVSERGSRYIDFVVPGLLGMSFMGNGIWGIGFAIVDARRKKLLKRFVATPMSRIHYLLSFLLMRLVLLVVEATVLTLFGVLAFGVPMRGSLLLFAGTCLLGAMTFGSMGLLIAARTRTVEGASGLMNVVMLPMWIGSGVFFSAGNFPAAVQPFIQALPLTAVNDALRDVMLRGEGWRVVSSEWMIAGAWLVICFVLALRLFRWK
jgi:ABC-type multidrug transport system permease subunit